MRATGLAVLAVCLVSGCMGPHLRKEIQPPGGCDQCHRGHIPGGWTISVSPVSLGREGRLPEAQDVILRELQAVPVHAAVPVGKLEVYAASIPPTAVGDAETGIQCFACHKSPGVPHEGVRGTFPHPWGRASDQR